MQTLLRHGNVPARERRLAVAGVGFGAFGQRVVASGMQPSRSRGYVQGMVRESGAGQPSQSACGVERCRKPPDTMSTSGGVRGGNREEPSYSIADVFIDLTETEAGIERLSATEMPHRLSDAILRD